MSERLQAPNRVTGTASLVVGGNTPGGSCIDGGSGNGPNTLRKFTFDPLDISGSSNSIRTFSINWGNRFPICVGTGWDGGEDLFLVAYHDGIAQAPVTLATGNNNATFSIATHQYTRNIPACVNSFYFEIYITTNRRDELLFIDDVKVTTPALNAPIQGASPISGDASVCIGATETLSVTASPNTTYTWSGLPAGATFITPNGTTSSHTIDIDWGTAAPGTYAISVTPSALVCGSPASGASSTINITVTASPQLTITPNGSICSGQSFPITVSGATGYAWDNGLGTASAVTVSPAATTTYTVTGSVGNCSSTASVTVTVNPSPVITIQATPASICAGQTATLTASGGISYTWQAAPGLSATTGATVTVNPTATTTYTVEGSDGNCTATATQNITLTPSPQLTVSPDVTICHGQSTTLSVSGAGSYSWDNGLGTAGSQSVSPATTTTYTVTGSNNNCSSTASVTVTVTPSITVSASSSPTAVCPGGLVTLTASGATSYTWAPAPGLNATTGASVTANPTTTTTYTVTGTTGSCSSTTSVIVNISPSLTINATASPASVCPGGSSTLTATGAGTYTWTPATGLSGTTGSSVTASPSSTTTYTVSGTSGTCQGSATVTVTVSPVVVVNAGNDITVCEGSAVTLSGSGADVYSWDNGVSNGVAFTATTTTTYTVTGTTLQGCAGIDQVTITVETAPVAAFSSDVQGGCLPLNVQFTQVSAGGTGYNWNFGDGTTSTDQNPLHTYYSSGCHDISLEVTSANGCSRIVNLQDYVCIQPRPIAAFSSNPAELSESNPVANFVNASENAVAYAWNFGDGTVSTQESPVHTYIVNDVGYEVTLYAYNSAGCVDSTKQMLPFNESPVYYVPNAFTPDGNEFNQTFQPVFTAGFDPQRFHLEIYDRWGERIFESLNPEIGWDGVSVAGTIVPDGVYVWKISFNLRNSDDKRVLSGHVALIR